MTKVKIIAIVLAVVIIGALAAPLAVKGACRIIYGGGLKKDGTSYCAESDAKQTQTPKPTQNTTQTMQQQQQMLTQTKGGLPIDQQSTTKGGQTMVYPPTNTKQIPNTGPELFALISLLPAGIAGILLRRKTQA